MKLNLKHHILIILCLLLCTIACEVTLFSDEKDQNELSAGEIALTNQVELQTSVAKTVQALGPIEEPETAGETGSESDNPPDSETPTSTPRPCNKPNFQNETIPDDTEFEPGESFTKTWTIRNDGTCSWTPEYRLVFKGGDQMNGPSTKAFTETINPGETVTLEVDLIAPASNGSYTGTWKIRANDGEEFGNYWATINVNEPGEEESAHFVVTSVSFTDSDQMQVGFCPHMFNLQAEIKVNGKGTVKYHWIISNGFESAVESLTFDEPGTRTAILNKNLSCSGTSTCSYVVELYIDTPNNQKFGAWPIAIHCM